ncbi:MAG: hypothetical protein KatS3mg076_2483 [Candidatus Binatia bacterium]|nr:MAG: hypothetical protein KatS3mg076_2483 [Candidatus Binatia bacterium]
MQLARPTLVRSEVKARVLELLREIAKIDPDSLTEDSSLDEDIRLESVAFVELQVALEDEYQIEIDPIQVVELNRLGSIIDYIHELAADGSRA